MIAVHSDLTVLASRLTTALAPLGVPVILEDDVVHLHGADWTIRITPDAEADSAYNATGYTQSPDDVGPGVDRAFSGTSLEHHERIVAQWVNVYQARSFGLEVEQVVYMDDDDVQYAIAEAADQHDPMPWEDASGHDITLDGVPWDDHVVGELGSGPGVESP